MSELVNSKKFRAWANPPNQEGLTYMPSEFRDFHDQKDLFKEIFETYQNAGKGMTCDLNWVDAHCFTVDTFLWHMARKGYTLQKSRAKIFKEEL